MNKRLLAIFVLGLTTATQHVQSPLQCRKNMNVQVVRR